MIIFSHGNGCDIGSMYETMSHYRNYWKAHVFMWYDHLPIIDIELICIMIYDNTQQGVSRIRML
jgi:hypothetical protein